MPADGGLLSGPLTIKTFSAIAAMGGATGTFLGCAYIKYEEYVEKRHKEKANFLQAETPSTSTQKMKWSRRGKDFALEWTTAGILMVFLIPETHIISGEMKLGAQFLMNEVAEHYPNAKVSFHDCVFVIEHGKNTIL